MHALQNVFKVLEKMQKAEKTKDDVYEEFVSNFKRQEVSYA